jgi:hypothetical protein
MQWFLILSALRPTVKIVIVYSTNFSFHGTP